MHILKKLPWLVITPVALFTLIAILAPWISPYDPTARNYGAILQGPSAAHWLGADYLGRDMLSRLINGASVSLFAISMVLASALLIGVVIGSLAGYAGGKVELVLISAIDIVLSLPSLIAALTMAWWANYTRMSRSVVASELHQPYIEAARIMGAGHVRIFSRHILPHVLALVVVYASADSGALVLAIATLSFLGLGVEPPTPE